MKVVVCPQCSVRINISTTGSGRIICPKCGKEMRIKLPPQSTDASAADAKPSTIPTAVTPPAKPAPQRPQHTTPVPTPQASADPFAPLPTTPMHIAGGAASTSYGSRATVKTTSTSHAQKAFLKRLAIIVGVLSAIILLSLPLTYVSGSFLSLIPITVATLSMLGLAIWAQVWFLLIAFKESSTQGILVLFVPYYWLFFFAKRKMQCLLPFLVFGSALIPAMLGLIIVSFFKPDFERSATSLRLSGAQRSALIERIETAQKTSPDANVVQSPKFDVMMVRHESAASAAESALAALPGYVAGSFQFAADQKSLTFKYRGDRSLASQYGLVLPGEAGIYLNLAPVFEGPK